MLFDILFSYTDDDGNIFSSSKEIEAPTKNDALNKYNALAAENGWVGIDNIDNVKSKTH